MSSCDTAFFNAQKPWIWFNHYYKGIFGTGIQAKALGYKGSIEEL
jgi:hypothetical protein